MITYVISSLVAVHFRRRYTLADNTQMPSAMRCLPLSLVLLCVFVVVIEVLFNLWGDAEIWITLLSIQTVLGILTPTGVILTSSQFRYYIIEVTQGCVLYVKELYEKYFLQRTPQVSPLEE